MVLVSIGSATKLQQFRASIPAKPNWGEPAWLISTDFQSEKDFLEASELGYFPKRFEQGKIRFRKCVSVLLRSSIIKSMQNKLQT